MFCFQRRLDAMVLATDEICVLELFTSVLLTPTLVTAQLTGLHEDLQLGLVADIDGNGLVGSREQIETSASLEQKFERLRETIEGRLDAVARRQGESAREAREECR